MPEPLPSDRPVRWGILGAGGIADQVSSDIGRSAHSVVAAVGARDAGRAADFARRHSTASGTGSGLARSYGSYAELVADDEVDVVYVATTHPQHYEHALLAIEAGKAVLIEKPVCLNAPQTRTVLAAAIAADVFSMEAMWMRTNPLIRKAQELIAQGAIGDVVGVRAEFGLGLPYDPGHRLYDLDNGGGALLDLGIYPLTFAYVFLGRPDRQLTVGSLAPTGADQTVAVEWIYGDTPRAQLWCSSSTPAPNSAVVLGSTGWLSFEGSTHRPTGLNLVAGDRVSHFDDPIAGQGNGYGPEIAEVERCLRAGEVQSPLIPHADTIAILELLDQARADLGVRYPQE